MKATKFNRYIAIISEIETEEAKSLALLKPKINGLRQYVKSNWGGQHTSLSVSTFGIDWLGNRFPIH